MRKTIFAILAASFMVLVAFGSMPASADANGVIFGTVKGIIENDWGEDQTINLAGVAVTITAKNPEDGTPIDSRTVYTDGYGYYSHTVNFDNNQYTLTTVTVEVALGEKTYKFYGDAENAKINIWNRATNFKKVNINMPGEEVEQSKEKTVFKPVFNNHNMNRILLRNMFKGLFEALSL